MADPIERLIELGKTVAGNDVDIDLELRHRGERLELDPDQTTVTAQRLTDAGVPTGTQLVLDVSDQGSVVFVPDAGGRWLVRVSTLAPVTSYYEAIVDVRAPIS